MHLSLFAIAVAVLPHPPTPQVEPRSATSDLASPLLAGHLEIRLRFRARGPTPSGAALEVGTLLTVLRDSLRGRQFGDPSTQLALRSLVPAASQTDSVGGFDATISLTVGATELPRLAELFGALAAAGPVSVSDVQVKVEPGPVPYAALLALATGQEDREPSALPSIGGKVGTIALILLAIRRELRR
jgi:hypothetical protein